MQVEIPYELVEKLVLEVLKRNKVALATEPEKENDYSKKEEESPDYKEAVEAEIEEIKKGNYNYKGVKG